MGLDARDARVGSDGVCCELCTSIPMGVIVDGDPARGWRARADRRPRAPSELALPDPRRRRRTRPMARCRGRVPRTSPAISRPAAPSSRESISPGDSLPVIVRSPLRALALTAACAFGAAARSDAAAAASRLASFGLELPTSAVSPDVEAMIGKAIEAAGAEVPHKLAITGEDGARLTVDGRAGRCALPCTARARLGRARAVGRCRRIPTGDAPSSAFRTTHESRSRSNKRLSSSPRSNGEQRVSDVGKPPRIRWAPR